MGEGGPATVLLVDDHPLVRQGLGALLGLEPWVGRVVQAGTVREGARTAVLERVDIAVVDLGLPDGDGVDLVRMLRRAPGCPVLVLTLTRDSAAAVQECLDAGASGYVLKDTDPDVVVRAVRSVMDGALVLGPNVRSALRGPRRTRLAAPLDRLSPTDLRLLTHIAQGRTNSEIADELGIAEKTVRNRVSVLIGVLGVADRLQAALLARDRGLVD
jgi:two-component system, NarL family, nitrate/nitrite response regulator NarL